MGATSLALLWAAVNAGYRYDVALRSFANGRHWRPTTIVRLRRHCDVLDELARITGLYEGLAALRQAIEMEEEVQRALGEFRALAAAEAGHREFVREEEARLRAGKD